MADQNQDKRQHLQPQQTSQTRPFTAHSPKGGPAPLLPALDRVQHGTHLQAQLIALRPACEAAKQRQLAADIESGVGILLQFTPQPDTQLAFEKLASEAKHKGIELLSVQERDGKPAVATVFVPDGQLQHFERLIVDYLAEKKSVKGSALDNKKLLNTIADIRDAVVDGLWTDEPSLLLRTEN